MLFRSVESNQAPCTSLVVSRSNWNSPVGLLPHDAAERIAADVAASIFDILFMSNDRINFSRFEPTKHNLYRSVPLAHG